MVLTKIHIDTVKEILEESGEQLKEETIKHIVGAIESNYEYGLLTPTISHAPEKNSNAEEIKKLESEILAYKKNVASRHNISPNCVYIRNGEVCYDRR